MYYLKLPKKLKYLSISTRISILLGIIILIAMGAFSFFNLIKQKENAISSITNNTEQLSQTIEKVLRVNMLKNRRDEISLAIKNLVGNEGIKSVRIINHKGVIKFSSKKSEINKNISHSDQLCISCHTRKNEKINFKNYLNRNYRHYRIDNENKLIFNSLPIYNAPGCYTSNCHATATQSISSGNKISKLQKASFSEHDSSQTILGFIEIEVSIKKVISGLEKTQGQLIFLTVLFAIIASIITYFTIRYFIGKPVKNLVDGTIRVAEGDFNHEIPPSKAELGLLSDSFNKMQKQLVTKQTQLIESEKLASVGKLADEIANEINNPLTGIIVYSESLINGNDNDDIKNDYETIHQEALKIRESIRNILSLTKQEKPDFNMVEINRIINHAVSVVGKFSNFRNIQIITGISKAVPAVSADPGLLEQVFLNLLLISSESMPGGGILNISTGYEEENKEIEVTFSDTGKGIPDYVVKKIFEPDYTAELKNISHSDQFREKTVISFTVCKDIIEMHKGKININSNENGNSITIKLPVS